MIAIEPLESRTLFAAGLPRFDHVVVVVEENHSYEDIINGAGTNPNPMPPFFGGGGPMPFMDLQGNQAPYINALAKQGALFTASTAISHPSEPNYLALFSGSVQGVHSDATPKHPFTAPNLGGELLGAGLSFAGYSESLPSVGYTGGSGHHYGRQHNPWVNFTDVPPESNQPFSNFPTDFTQLPTVSFVVPNLVNDMHSGTVKAGDSWLKNHLSAYATWAQTHNSLLIVTFDEGHGSSNHIPTLMVGQGVKPGKYAERISHFNVLRTIEDVYDLPAAGQSANVAPITDVFATS